MILFDESIMHRNQTLSLHGHFKRMRDPHKGQPVLPIEREHQVDDLLAGLTIQCPGRLVCPDNGGVRRQGARNGKALALPTTHFRWAVPPPSAQSNSFNAGQSTLAGLFRTHPTH